MKKITFPKKDVHEIWKAHKIMNIISLICFSHNDAMRHDWRMRHRLTTHDLEFRRA